MRHDKSPDVTRDAVLGGQLTLLQPKRGHRVGHDAILLAAATSARARGHAIDLGAGVGAAGLALARRVGGLRVTLVEIDPFMAQLADENIAANGFADRVRAVVLDVAAPGRAFATAGLGPGCATAVLMNPPFNDPVRHNVSPHARRALAHAGARSTLRKWLHTAGRLLVPEGVVTLIWRAEGIADVLDALSGQYGGVCLMPVHSKPGAAAIRVLVAARKRSRAPIAILPGLVLNDADGRPSAEAEAVLRDAVPLPLASC
jgi:tRNA1(Val) A37 N6-methylase TrmN6